jgi:hypothetical protein
MFPIFILNRDGEKAGLVPHGTQSFRIKDRELPDFWYHTFRDIPVTDDEQERKFVDCVFTQAGYRVIR